MKKNKDNIPAGAGITEESLETVAGGIHSGNDHYHRYRCTIRMPDGKCHIRDPDARCVHLSVETIPGDSGPEKYRYVCGKGCFDYQSGIKLH